MANKIKKLSLELYQQISAGEIIERPSSIIKELFENSIDAGSTEIILQLEKGGKETILLRDNGIGINKNDLMLAKTPHATSKIVSVKDLHNINTLGFRGEALSSINSIAKVNIYSRTKEDEHAWYIDDSNNNEIIPYPHPIGTSVKVSNIFYNTPARLKFLKKDHTEYIHIDKLIKTFMLYHFNIELTIIHNGKKIIFFPQANTLMKQQKRISTICGNNFFNNSIMIKEFSTLMNMKLKGWISEPILSNTIPIQHLYVNGRIIKNRIILNAIKNAYKDVIHRLYDPSFILFFEINTNTIDINVHPTKNEIKFSNNALVHDFIFFNINKNIYKHKNKVCSNIARNKINNKTNNDHDHPLGYAIGQLHGIFILSQNKDNLIIVDMHAAHERIVYEKLKNLWKNEKINSQKLLFPITLDLNSIYLDLLIQHKQTLNSLGFFYDSLGLKTIILREVPVYLKNKNIENLLIKIAQNIEYTNNIQEPDKYINNILSTISCHKALRANDYLINIENMNKLLRQIENTNNSYKCNHGRPTWKSISLKYLNKLFMRGK